LQLGVSNASTHGYSALDCILNLPDFLKQFIIKHWSSIAHAGGSRVHRRDLENSVSLFNMFDLDN
jgi:hypothetical protein